MSTRSRPSGQPTEAAPSDALFHSSLGSLDPIALRLEMVNGPHPEASYAQSIEAASALLHERHHWLQHVGTGAGMFGGLLLEVQGAVTGEVVMPHGLASTDVPLSAHPERFAEPLRLWHALEATRRAFFGCRTSDLTDLERQGRTPLWRTLGPHLHSLAAGVYGDLPEAADLLDDLRRGGETLEPDYTAVTEAGWILGARHLMEGAARMSEVTRLAVGAAEMHYSGNWDGKPFRFESDRHFTGVYGLARKLFSRMVGQEAAAAEVGFAFACDVALNSLAPPVCPIVPESPGLVFLRVCKALADFRFDRAVDFTDSTGIRALISELTEHLGADEQFVEHLYWKAVAGGAFAALDVEQTAASMYTLDSPYLPNPRGNGARLRYSTALSVRAIALRAQAPELFVFPAALYLEDRKHFRELFDQIPPPLVAYGDSGLWPTREQPGWLEFFLAAGVQGEILRGVVECTVPELAARLVPYLRSGLGPRHGSLVVRMAIDSTLGDSPLAGALWRHVEPVAG